LPPQPARRAKSPSTEQTNLRATARRDRSTTYEPKERLPFEIFRSAGAFLLLVALLFSVSGSARAEETGMAGELTDQCT
jgi:hypothetical protein